MPFTTVALAILTHLTQGSEPMPIPLAFQARRIAPGERPVSSPDGKFVVYAVKELTASGTDAAARQERYAPSGTPGNAIGNHLYLTEVATGKTVRVGPERGNALRPSWSPNGDAIAFYGDSDGKLQLWLYTVAAGTSRRLSEASVRAHLWPGDAPEFMRDGKSVLVGLIPKRLDTAAGDVKSTQPAEAAGPMVYKSGEEEGEDGPGVKPGGPLQARIDRENAIDIALVSLNSGTPRILVSGDEAPTPSVARLSTSGKYVSYLTVFRPAGESSLDSVRDLVVRDLDSGTVAFKAENLAVGEGAYFTGAYRWHPRNDRLYYVQGARMWELDLTKEKPEPRALAKALGDVNADIFAFTDDGETVVFGLVGATTGIDKRSGVQNLASVALGAGPLMTLTVPEKWSIHGILTTGSPVAWQPDKGEIRVLARDSGSGESGILSLGARTGELRVLVKGRFALEPVGRSSDPAKILAVREALDTPESIVEFDASVKTPRSIVRIEPRLDDVKIGGASSYSTQVVGHDGKLRSAQATVLFPPDRKDDEHLPAVAFVYGGARLTGRSGRFGGGDAASLPVSIFTTRGYAVLLLDGLISPEGSKGNPIQELRDAVQPQIVRAGELGFIDLDRVAVMGQSYGGYCAASLLTASSLFRAGVAVSGLYDLPGLFGWMSADGTDFIARWSESGQGRMGGHPWEDLRRYLDNSPYYRADRLMAPLLLVHGEADTVCPVADAKKMLNAMKRLKKPGELLVYRGEGHVVSEWSEANAIDAAERILAFLGQELKGDR